jgi:hypothetical protein
MAGAARGSAVLESASGLNIRRVNGTIYGTIDDGTISI